MFSEFYKTKKMAEANGAGKDSGVPISELTLGEAESFLDSLMCLPEKPESMFCILLKQV